MSLLTNQSEVRPGVSFWAPASGGSGGISTIGPALSSISSISALPYSTLSLGPAVSAPAAALASLSSAAASVSSLSVSSINGAVPGAIPANLTVSSLTAAGNVSTNSVVISGDIALTNPVGVEFLTTAGTSTFTLMTPSQFQFSTLNTYFAVTNGVAVGDATFTTNYGGPPSNVITQFHHDANNQYLWTTSQRGVFAVNMDKTLNNNNIYTDFTPKGAPYDLSGIVAPMMVTAKVNGGYPFATPVSTVATLNRYYTSNINVQNGYCDSVPYASTILFPSAYTTDTDVVVMITPTNKGVSGGNNPNISLVDGFGTNGVSSIGFQVDSRDGGVGYAGSFYWVALPRQG